MQFVEGCFYHIYNRGNDKRRIFFADRNYVFFLEKVRKYIMNNSDVICWCLMPNHFHFLVQANEQSVKYIRESPLKINALTEGIRMLLSSYTKAIQKQEQITGNLFQQKTKSKLVDQYIDHAFHYIHQNPIRANLVKKIEDWPWSSFTEYSNPVKNPICNREIASNFVDLNTEQFVRDSYSLIPDNFL
ncbi:MAG: transposase [Flammeovirgaceae bacterium]|nr:transposase [Flammeovirgaceae bacterium]